MESLKQEAAKVAEDVGEKVEEKASGFTEIIKEVVNNLTGKDMAVTYEFDNLQIEMPKATGPDGKEIGSAKWKIDGKFVMSTQISEKSKAEYGR
jgi:hypothetical protein